jgi:integrase
MAAHAIPFQKVRGVEHLYRYAPTGKFYARFSRHGIEYRRSLGTSDKETAKRELTALLRIETLRNPNERAITLARLVDRYLETIQNQARHTIVQKKGICARIKRDWKGGSDVLVRKILPSQLEAFIARRGLGASQGNAFATVFRQIFDLAVTDKAITDSPARGALKWQKRKDPDRLTPDAQQFAAVIADVRAQPFNRDADDSGDFLEAMGLLGLGQAELSALARRDVHFERRRIRVYRRKTSKSFEIPIYPQARALLERLCSGKRQEVRIFAISDAKKALANSCARLGFPPFTQRSLRRFFITNALERGVDVQTIARWQGHSDGGKLILDTYGHVRAPHSERMAALMTDGEPANVVPMPKAKNI